MRFIKGATADQRTHAGNAMNYETRQRFDRAMPYYGTSGSSAQTMYRPPSAAPAQPSGQAPSVDMSAYRPGQAQPRVQSFGQAYGGGSPNFNERTGEYAAPPTPDRVYKGGSPNFDERTGQYTDGRDQIQYFGSQQNLNTSQQSRVLEVSQPNQRYDQEMARQHGRDAVLQARAIGDTESRRAQQQSRLRQSLQQNKRFRNPPPTPRPAAPPPSPENGKQGRRGPYHDNHSWTITPRDWKKTIRDMQQPSTSPPSEWRTPKGYSPGRYYNDRGRGFGGTMSFAPEATAADRGRAYERFAAEQGYYRRKPNGERLPPPQTPTPKPAAPPPAPRTAPPLNDGRKIRRGPVGGYADEPIQMAAPPASQPWSPWDVLAPRTEVVSTPPMTFGNPVPQPSFNATYTNFDGSVTDQPNFPLRDAFVQNINDAMMPYHMGQKGGPPQFDFQAMLARSGDMVDAGYQNPLAALFG